MDNKQWIVVIAVLLLAASPAFGQNSPVLVSLGWDEPVDMDLEIWTADGDEMIANAFNYRCDDVIDGSEEEYFFFENYDDHDFSRGEYVVSVYFAGRDRDPKADAAQVSLTVSTADGRTLRRQKTVYWEEGRDQWHAFQIDGASGEIVDLDEFIQVKY